MKPADQVLTALPGAVRQARPVIWRNPHWRPAAEVVTNLPVSPADIAQARALWQHAAPLLARLFPALSASGGRIDSALLPAPDPVVRALGVSAASRVFVKADHDLPVTGSIKARGGIFEVLWYALSVAREEGFDGADTSVLADAAWRQRFAACRILVGSTGNLGFSVGLAARALGFQAEVHLSTDAKRWKKDRLRDLGVTVVEHAGDYTRAVAAARSAAAAAPRSHFVDDESSRHLFLGYATAAENLAEQLAAAGIAIDSSHPLQVYLPCGVGGAPGGVCVGLKHLWGDAVRCVFVEPVQSPSMLLQLAAGPEHPVSVYDVGLTNITIADGLACASASALSARIVAPLVSAVVTVDDPSMLAWVRAAWQQAGLRLEPSAAAAFEACAAMARAPEFDPVATHVLWTTGGAMLPDVVFEELMREAEAL